MCVFKNIQQSNIFYLIHVFHIQNILNFETYIHVTEELSRFKLIYINQTNYLYCTISDTVTIYLCKILQSSNVIFENIKYILNVDSTILVIINIIHNVTYYVY